MPLLPPDRNYQGVLLPNQHGEKYHSRFANSQRKPPLVMDYNNLGNSHLNFIGGFRVSESTYGASRAQFANGVIEYNPVNNSIFLAGHDHHQAIAEFEIPALTNSSDVSSYQVASPVQDFWLSNPSRSESHKISGIKYVGNKLIVNWFKFYDQGGASELINTTFLVDGADNFQAATVYGGVEVNGNQRAAGWISEIPVAWQHRLGVGQYLSGWTGSTARAGIHVSSSGPSAFSVDYNSFLADPANTTLINSTPLAWYNLSNLPFDYSTGREGGDHFLYNRGLDNDIWTHHSECSYGFVIPNTEYYICFGRMGGGTNGMDYGQAPYGSGQGHYTWDRNDKGPHYWIFRLQDLEQVKLGNLTPHTVLPYDYGYLNVPLGDESTRNNLSVKGGGYDATNNILYLSILGARPNSAPVIVAYSLN